MDRTEILEQFGRRVRALRKEKGFTQEGFAMACDLDRAYVGSIERGQRNVSLLTQHILASTLEVSIAHLMEGIGREETAESRGNRR